MLACHVSPWQSPPPPPPLAWVKFEATYITEDTHILASGEAQQMSREQHDRQCHRVTTSTGLKHKMKAACIARQGIHHFPRSGLKSKAGCEKNKVFMTLVAKASPWW